MVTMKWLSSRHMVTGVHPEIGKLAIYGWTRTSIVRGLKAGCWFTAVLCCCQEPAALAHPHAFVACTVSIVMDSSGLVGFRQRWVLDEMTTASVLDVVNMDRNASLSAEEKASIRDLAVRGLKSYHYFTAVRINDRIFPVQTINDFSAELKDNQLVYDFLVPCRVAALPGKRQKVKLAVYDDSFFHDQIIPQAVVIVFEPK